MTTTNLSCRYGCYDEVSKHFAGPQHWTVAWQYDRMPAPKHRFFATERAASSIARSYALTRATVYVYPPKNLQ